MNALTVPYLCGIRKVFFLCIQLVQNLWKTTLVCTMLLIPHIVVPQMLLLQPSSGLGVSETNSLGGGGRGGGGAAAAAAVVVVVVVVVGVLVVVVAAAAVAVVAAAAIAVVAAAAVVVVVVVVVNK